MLYRGFSTQEELDAQYDLRAAVPDFPRYAGLYERESRKAREEMERRLDVPWLAWACLSQCGLTIAVG